MRISSLVLGAILFTACGPDSVPFQITFVLGRSDTNKCHSDSCENIPVSCDTSMLIRIADASDDSVSYLRRCFTHEPRNPTDSLCSLADPSEVELPVETIPNKMVRVQMAVWRQEDLAMQNIAPTDCPDVTFNQQNEPIADPTPMLGGQTYFKVGSSDTARITIQCIDDVDLDAPECRGVPVSVSAQVELFDSLVDIGGLTALDYDVSIATPTTLPASPDEWTIDPANTISLDVTTGTIAVWSTDLSDPLGDTTCVQAFNRTELAGATTIRCMPTPSGPMLHFEDDDAGFFVPKDLIDRLTQAIGQLPQGGVSFGVVLDAAGQPLEGVTVAPDSFGDTVRYLNDDYTSTSDSLGIPLTATSASGAFVSTSVPFETLGALTSWHLGGTDPPAVLPTYGGKVRGKLTFIKLQLAP